MNRWLALGLLLAIGLALGLRLPQLDRRPMHNDEAVNAYKFGELWKSGSYTYDPNEHHGPTLIYATYLFERATGSPDYAHVTETRLRLITALFGIGMILLLPLIVDGLGARATLWAGLFTAVSPAMVFYSRYYIHEVLLVFFTFLALAAGWRYWRSRKIGWAVLTGAALGLMDATKETFVIALVAAGVALALNQLWNRKIDASRVPAKASHVPFAHAAILAATWLAVAVIFFTSFFTNASGPLDSIRTYAPWFHRAEGASPHIHPWYYYLHLLLFFHLGKGPIWSEALIVALAAIGGWAGFARKKLTQDHANFVRFLAFYTAAMTSGYSLISYKTPWCLLGFWHGMILLAGVGVTILTRTIPRRLPRFAVVAAVLAGAGSLAWQAWRADTLYSADPVNPYVYAQTSPDILRLVDKIKELAVVAPSGNNMLIKVMSPGDDFWPLPWYLRAFGQVGWWGEVPSDPYAPVMVVSSKFDARLDEPKTHLMVGYFQLRPQIFFELYVERGLWTAYLSKHPAPSNE